MTPKYTGYLRKDAQSGKWEAELVDGWGWTISIEVTPDSENGGYTLTGTLGDAPEALRIPAIDGEKANG